MEERIHQRPEPEDTTAVLAEADDVDSDGGESEFEFPFVGRDYPALADELFADGRIRPFYPVFGRGGGGGGGAGSGGPAAAAVRRTRGQLGRLFLEETRERNSSAGSTASSASSSAGTDDDDGAGLEGAPPESYCLWAPGGSGASARPPRKSGSTGSMTRWRRISELVVGRSHSDGKEKFLFLPATPPPPKDADRQDKPKPKQKPNPAGGGKKSPPTEVNTVAAAHRIAYGAPKASAGGATTPRRTFLPYREELVGFFTNVNGISRSHPHPY